MRKFPSLQLPKFIKSAQKPVSQRWRTRNISLLLIIGGITLTVSITAVFSYQIVRSLILNKLKNNALLTIKQESQDIDHWLALSKDKLKTLAHTSSIRSMDWSIVNPYLQLELERIQDFYGFALAEPDGSYYTTKLGKSNSNLKDRKHFKKAIAGETYVSDPSISRNVDVTLVPISTPIFAPGLLTGKPIGVLNGAVSIEKLTQVVSTLKYGENSYAFALNSEGVPIVHPHQNLMGNIDKPAPSFLNSKDPNLAKLARQMIGKKSNIELIEIDGKWVYVSYVSLKEADWSIALVIPRSQLEKELNALNFLAIVLGILLGVALLASIILVKGFETTRVRAETEALLNRLSKRIRASLNLNEILETTVEELGTILHLERISFGWYNSEKKTLEISSEYCLQGLHKKIGTFYLESEEDVNNRLINGEYLRFLLKNQDNFNSEKFPEKAYFELKNDFYLAIPIFINSENQGYLIASNSRKFRNKDETQLLSAVADQLAIAITQSDLYTQTQAQVKLLDQTLIDLKRAQSRLVQSEKMSSLGQLVAGIAHEINNPISFIYGNISYANEYVKDLLKIIHLYLEYYPEPDLEIQQEIELLDLDFITKDLERILNSMKQGADRIRLIVLSLRNFSRLDEGGKKAVNIHEGIDNTLLLIQNRLENKISVVKYYSDLPIIDCYPSQLNQVFMNLIANAIDALMVCEIPEKIISIKTGLLEKNQRQFVTITITDNGPGIPPEILPKIFDPFFTTKPVGKGTGMGLAISYQIVTEVHGGTISIDTTSSGGVEALVEIPIPDQVAVNHLP